MEFMSIAFRFFNEITSLSVLHYRQVETDYMNQSSLFRFLPRDVTLDSIAPPVALCPSYLLILKFLLFI